MNLNKRDFEVLRLEPASLSRDIESQHFLVKKSRFSWFSAQQKKDGLRNFGRTWVFCFFNSEPLISIGPHWYLFCIMWLIGFALQDFMARFILFEFSGLPLFLTEITGYIAISSYFITAVKNQGIYRRNMIVIDCQNSKNFCSKCNVIATADMYHCEDCDVCVMEFDHHCPWTGKCIGKGNFYYFYTFIFSTFLYFFMIIIEVLWFFNSK